MTKSPFWDDLVQDVGYAARQLRRAPLFSAIVVLTLAVGIGANSAVFSVMNGVLLRPLPYSETESLVSVTTGFPQMDFDRFWMSPPEYYELREWNAVFEEVGAWRVGSASIETYDRPLQVVSAVATWSLFPTLGVAAALGRTFSEEEDRAGADPVVLISHRLWEGAFGSDPGLLGRDVRVGGEAARIVGVLPAGFDIEDAGVDLWIPVNRAQSLDPSDHLNRRGNHFLNVVGRVEGAGTLDRVQAELRRLELRSMEEFGSAHPWDPDTHPLQASDFRADLVGEARPAILLMMGAVGLVLLIACANAGSLLLAKSEGRSREVAVRVAMGAGPARLIRQLLTEGLVLALLGGALGLFLGHLTIRALLRVNPDGVPRVGEIGLDVTVVAFTATVALLTGLLFGLAPLLGTSLARVSGSLKEGGTRSTRGASPARARRVLVVAEVALAVVLLIGSGLMLRSVAEMQRVDLGFEREGVLTARLTLPAADYPTGQSVGAFYQTLLDRLGALPGVVSAGVSSGIPPTRILNANDTGFEGVPQTVDGPVHNVDYYTAIDGAYLRTLGIELVEGREFEPQDALAETPVLLVNERLAEVFYPGQSPVGRRIQPSGAGDLWFSVIGVVRNVSQDGVAGEVGTEIYFYQPQVTAAGSTGFRAMSIVLRTAGDPMSYALALEGVVRELDPTLPVAEVQTLEDNVLRSMGQPRFLTLLLGVFAAIAILLAGLGTYAVMSFSVSERTREIGIRMALGAQAAGVRTLILRQGATLAGLGLGIGVLSALGLTRLLTSQLYAVATTDPGTFLAAVFFLAAIALLASYLPALRAGRMEPVDALRAE